MFNMKKIMRRFIATASTLAMVFIIFSMNVFAQEPVAKEEETIGVTTEVSVEENGVIHRASWISVGTYGPGDYQIEYVNFKDKTNGAIRTYNTQFMQIKPAWKATDSSTSEVELLIKVIRKSNGEVAYEHRFKLSDDTDGKKDSEGWWYAESPFFRINKTSDYFFYYEVFTADGYQGTGNTRCGQVHLWVALK